MRTDTLPLGAPAAEPDPALAAPSGLVRLRDARRAAAPARATRRTWKEPPVFFFDPARQAELAAARPPAPPFPAPFAAAARRGPAAAWDGLAGRVRGLWPALAASAEVRRVARAVPGLRDAAHALAADHPAARDVADLLSIVDEEVVLALDPAAGTGFRLEVTGVADVNQLHVLLADALPGRRPSAAVVAACRDRGVFDGEPPVAEARFQLFAASALRPDATLPTGLSGSGQWLWGHRPAASVPRVGGERVVLLGEPAFAATWEVERRFPDVAADARIVAALTPAEVAGWLSERTGRPVAVPETPVLAPAWAA